MSSATTFEIKSTSSAATLALGKKLGAKLAGGEVIELVGDLGSGKTVLVRGLAEGAQSSDAVKSPTFTLSRIYRAKSGVTIHHFDFHRLSDGGVVAEELAEALTDPMAVVVIEWSGIIQDVLPKERLVINFTTIGENSRIIQFNAIGDKSKKLAEAIQ